MYEKFSCGYFFQYWQASKGSHVCGVACTVSELPLQTGPNKLITLRSKWLSSCFPSLMYLHAKRWEKPKLETLSFFYWTQTWRRQWDIQNKCKEIWKGCIITAGNHSSWQEGPPDLLCKILKSFAGLFRESNWSLNSPLVFIFGRALGSLKSQRSL